MIEVVHRGKTKKFAHLGAMNLYYGSSVGSVKKNERTRFYSPKKKDFMSAWGEMSSSKLKHTDHRKSTPKKKSSKKKK